MTSEPIKRNRYSFNNRECSFTASNFNQDFDDYHLPVVRTQISSLNEWGIAQGLEISGTIGSNTITIQEGVAIDSNGQIISLSSKGNGTLSNNPPKKVPVPVQLDTSTYPPDTTYYLTIQFDELEQSQTGRPCNRVLEQVPFLQLQPQTTYVDDGNSVILGQVVIDTQGKIQGLTSVGRRLVSKTVEQLQIRRADKVNDQVQQVSAGKIAPIAGGGLQITVPLATDQMLLAKEGSGNFGKLEVRADTLQLSGNTVIGTTQSPTEKLEVEGNVKITGARLKSAFGWGIVETDKQDWLRINPDSNYPAIALHKPVAIGTGGLAVGDWTQLASGELKVTQSAYLATANGGVSIGTTSAPEGKLQIINTSQDANGNTLILGPIGSSNLRLGYHTDYTWIQSHASKPLSINSLGNNVGIGTTTPKSLLEIRKDAPSALGAVLTIGNNSGGAGAGVAIDLNGYDVGTNAPTARIQSIDDGNNSSHIAFYTKRPGANTNQLQERLRINSGGNLEVQGDVKASGKLYEAGNPLIVKGMIMMWSGSETEIPGGWALCNGQNGTPDLRSRFIVGAGTGGSPAYASNQSGEPDQHSHSLDIPPQTFNTNHSGHHDHAPPSQWYDRRALQNISAAGKDFFNAIDRGSNGVQSARVQASGGHNHSVTVDYAPFNSGSSSGNNRPKWYALCLIMKL